ncbi:hypothetical protein KPATCC21470_2022 [Kitasatospora purpeofusca]
MRPGGPSAFTATPFLQAAVETADGLPGILPIGCGKRAYGRDHCPQHR